MWTKGKPWEPAHLPAGLCLSVLGGPCHVRMWGRSFLEFQSGSGCLVTVCPVAVPPPFHMS